MGLHSINDLTDNVKVCIGVCLLDENNVCIGCKRTIEEIEEAGS